MAAPKKISLSKSRLMRGLQCPKSLYLSVHQPALEGEVTAAQQAVFDQGHEVGVEAQKQFPGGVLIDASYRETAKALEQTTAAIKSGANTIYEATFQSDGVMAKVDILNRKSARSAWNLIEVKSSTSVKEQHLDDVAIQKMIVLGAGLKVNDAVLMHLNNKCEFPDMKSLFTQAVVSDEIEPSLAMLPEKMKELRAVLMAPKPPKIDIGKHCDSPYECPFKAHCWAEKKMPSPNVFDFPKIGQKGWKFYAEGVKSLDDPNFGPFKGTALHQIEAVRTGKRWVDREAIKEKLGEWTWPLYFLDFETIGFAIPRFEGTRPYQQLTFQFSLLLQHKPGGPIEQVADYLHEADSDPRLGLAEALIAAVGPKGSIVAYNMAFEGRCISELAEKFPRLKKKLSPLVDRLVDPLPIFRAAVYDRAFLGSFSIKSVAPAILGKTANYEGLAVADGQAAQLAFKEMIGAATPPAKKRELRAALLEYCQKDTMEMARLVSWLCGQ